VVGDDWAEEHHDVEVQDETGRRLGRARLPEGIAGITQLHGLIGGFLPEDAAPEQVVVGIETDRGGWVAALVAAGYQVFAVNPLQVARYRQRHLTSGAKSDAGDAHTLADMVRTDRHQLRPIAADSALAVGRSRSWPAPIRGWSGIGAGRCCGCGAAGVLSRCAAGV
jgi:transposase